MTNLEYLLSLDEDSLSINSFETNDIYVCELTYFAENGKKCPPNLDCKDCPFYKVRKSMEILNREHKEKPNIKLTHFEHDLLEAFPMQHMEFWNTFFYKLKCNEKGFLGVGGRGEMSIKDILNSDFEYID